MFEQSIVHLERLILGREKKTRILTTKGTKSTQEIKRENLIVETLSLQIL